MYTAEQAREAAKAYRNQLNEAKEKLAQQEASSLSIKIKNAADAGRRVMDFDMPVYASIDMVVAILNEAGYKCEIWDTGCGITVSW